MGAFDYISSFCSYTYSNNAKTKRKPLQTVDIKVKMDCDGCERRVRNVVRRMKGAKSVEVNRTQSRITVKGHVDPKKVLKRVMSTGKKAEFWPYIPQHMVYYPFAPGMYDKRAPAGHIRNPAQTFPTANAPEENYVSLFSDDNVQAACSIM